MNQDWLCQESVTTRTHCDRPAYRACLSAVIISLFVLCTAPFCSAATYEVLGHSFDIDTVESVGRSASRLVVFGEQKIVPNEVIGTRIVEAYYSRGRLTESFTPDAIAPFLRRALQEKQSEIAYLMFRALLVDQRLNEEALDSVLDELVAIPGTLAMLQRTILEGGATFSTPRVVGKTLFLLAQENPQWVRAHALRGVLLYKEEIRTFVKEAVRKTIKDGDQAGFDKSLAVERELFVDGGPPHEALLAAAQTAWRFSQSLSQGAAFDQFVTAREAVKSDALLADFLADGVRAAAHEGARRALDEKKPDLALEYLSRLGASSRSPLTYELVRSALRTLEPQRDSLLLRQDVIDFLRLMASGDPELVPPLRQVLKAQMMFSAQQGGGAGVGALRSFYVSLGGDTEQLKPTQRSTSPAPATEAPPSNSATERGKSLIKQFGKGGTFVLLFLLLLGPAFVAFRLYETSKSRMLRTRRGAGVLSEREEQRRLLRFGSQRPNSQSRFGGSRAEYSKDPIMREYVEALKRLHLDHKASLRDIKFAYRTTVKELHPDVQQGIGDHASEGFIELTKLYERILSLRRQLGMDT